GRRKRLWWSVSSPVYGRVWVQLSRRKWRRRSWLANPRGSVPQQIPAWRVCAERLRWCCRSTLALRLPDTVHPRTRGAGLQPANNTFGVITSTLGGRRQGTDLDGTRQIVKPSRSRSHAKDAGRVSGILTTRLLPREFNACRGENLDRWDIQHWTSIRKRPWSSAALQASD